MSLCFLFLVSGWLCVVYEHLRSTFGVEACVCACVCVLNILAYLLFCILVVITSRRQALMCLIEYISSASGLTSLHLTTLYSIFTAGVTR